MIEGDKNTWHIRLLTKAEEVEVWQLYKGDSPQSSGVPKEFAQAWRDAELAKEPK